MADGKQAALRWLVRAIMPAITLTGALSLTVAAERVAAQAVPAAATTNARFLALSDIHYTPNVEKCGQHGYETDPVLWAAAQTEGQKLIADERPAFAIYLGDLPSHCNRDHTGEFIAALGGLANIVGSGTKLIYVPGNNDSLDGDYGPFTSAAGTTPLDVSPAWGGKPVLNAQPGDMIDTSHLAQGYYSVYAVQGTATAPALRVVILNTTMFTRAYHGLDPATYQDDVNDQIDWLQAQLQDVHAKGEKVIIAMHVPPGINGYTADASMMWNPGLRYTGSAVPHAWVQRAFLTIVTAAAPDIVGLLSSHTHYNEIRRLRDCNGVFAALDVAVPSITTDHGNNPSMKIFDYDDRFEWTANRTFYATGATGAAWDANKALTFADNYPCPTCAPGSTLRARIATLGKAPVHPNAALTRLMIAWLRVGAPPKPGPASYQRALDVTCMR